jgi:SAM-dependent methyltransferase
MQRALAGAEYVASISRRPSDLRARAAFQSLALQLVSGGARILDFGAGPGIDARFFAQHGCRVRAYEIDPRMQSYFRELCAPELASGLIELDSRAYSEFIEPPDREPAYAADLVTANFAPLNLVDDLEKLFRRLSALTAAQGRVLASVLSPYFIGDWGYPWWWRGLPGLLRSGRLPVAGTEATISRRTPRAIADAAARHFRLIGIWPGRPARLERPVGASHPSLFFTRYLFMAFEKGP